MLRKKKRIAELSKELTEKDKRIAEQSKEIIKKREEGKQEEKSFAEKNKRIDELSKEIKKKDKSSAVKDIKIAEFSKGRCHKHQEGGGCTVLAAFGRQILTPPIFSTGLLYPPHFFRQRSAPPPNRKSAYVLATYCNF